VFVLESLRLRLTYLTNGAAATQNRFKVLGRARNLKLFNEINGSLKVTDSTFAALRAQIRRIQSEKQTIHAWP
jgi:hypothetical protein